MKSFLSLWLPVLLWAGVIFMASSNPNPYQLLPASWADHAELLGRYMHIGEYAILAALLLRALVWRREMSLGLLAVILGLSALYALSDETHQLFVPGRAFQLLDLALDVTGAVIGLLLYTFIRYFGKGLYQRNHFLVA
jgi:VanZ family protein